MPIIIYNGAREQTFSMYTVKDGKRSPKNVRLTPGSNPITQKDYDCLCETSDGFKYFKDETNEISVIDDDNSIVVKEDRNGDVTTEIDITKLSAADAVKVVGDTYDADILEQYSRDGRPSVMKAIEEQKELLESGDSESGD